MIDMFKQLFLAFTYLFKSFELGAKSMCHIAEMAEQSAAAMKDVSFANRQAQLKELNEKHGLKLLAE